MTILVIGSLCQDDNVINSFVQSAKNEEIVFSSDYHEAKQQWFDLAPEIVIIEIDDISNPNSYSLIEYIRDSTFDDYTFIIGISTNYNIDNRQKYYNFGADVILFPPISSEELFFYFRVGKRLSIRIKKDTLIFALSQVIKAKNHDAGKQIDGVPVYCVLLAKGLKANSKYESIISKRFINDLYILSSIHDLGKIGIDDAILNNPGIYTSEERHIMQKHPIIGSQIIQSIIKKYPELSYLQAGSDIMRWHHEHFSGNGYPDGIQGKIIPLMARIVALADVYDALVNERVYREAMSHEEARNYILTDSLHQFDPNIIEAFIKCEDKFKTVKKDDNKPDANMIPSDINVD